LEGLSFVPLLRNPERLWKQAALTVVSRGMNIDATKKLDASQMGRTVFNGRWRYTQWPDGTGELYDHDVDSCECRNLASDVGQSAKCQEFKSLLERGWRAALPADAR
jgi:iduronate 2-sulfatase